MEIDPKGRMWILDVGRMNSASSNKSDTINGPASLMRWDMINNVEIDR